MTFWQARRWLDKIGGEWTEAKEPRPGTASIIVTVKSAKGHTVSRRAVFDDTLTGYERGLAIHQAFARACVELKAALR